MEKVIIETNPVEYNGKTIQSVGKCPKCGSPVEYIGIGPTMDSYAKGLSFKGHKGVCVKCQSPYLISSD